MLAMRGQVIKLSHILRGPARGTPVLNEATRTCPLQQSNFRNMSSGSKPKVFVTNYNIPKKGLDLLKSCEVVQWQSEETIQREDLIKNVKGIDALFCILTDKIDGTLLDACGPQLKAVGTMSVGYDHIDMKACKERGIPVGFTPDVLTDATAELTVALLLATSRRLMEGAGAVRSGEWGMWNPQWMCGQGLHHSTVGIFGLGRIGLAVAKRLRPFGISQLLYSGRKENPAAKEVDAEFVSFDTLLSESDFVIAGCALNSETKEIFNEDTFKKMKPTAIFVNSSRGGVVDQKALYEALKSGQIKAAGLDVTTPEPLPTDSPLLDLKNCVVLPHIGSATVEARNAMAELTARNIMAALNGEQMPCQIE
ncbi:glyoxylate reductase/hydroxypyruvate reductase [Lingula anatina]|uniref:Glyoxylate reductase/hydroxypyruvate reductase n=1 Tax=Lingula anatina TaxID=7574 RepID=A0A1S3ID78_LINAN|nr:glyoxylate reductase/hydroxypyruvate reductase [Lingula anatina]|eukprot:XP_013395816.1 glyoxylate reductase/hydroxypyruvate reductase [Lingula anatina]